MPQAIIYDKDAGLREGITQAGTALGQALQQRGEKQKNTNHRTFLSNLIDNLGPEPSNMDIIGAYKQAVDKGIPQPMVDNVINLYQSQRKATLEQQKVDNQKFEASVLNKYRKGETLTAEEEASFTPSTQRALIKENTSLFETESDKLEAKKASELATDIEKDYQIHQSEEQRLSVLEKLTEKDQLSTPLMVTALDAFGIPLSVLGNPDTEEYAKVQADYVTDVSKIFPGQIRVFEIEAYLKTIPSLMNSKEGREAIFTNRKLMNDARKLKYDAYVDIIKENNGKKPQNMGILINERIKDEMAIITDKFRTGMQGSLDKHQQPLKMKDAQGKPFKIPPYRVEEALAEGFTF